MYKHIYYLSRNNFINSSHIDAIIVIIITTTTTTTNFNNNNNNNNSQRQKTSNKNRSGMQLMKEWMNEKWRRMKRILGINDLKHFPLLVPLSDDNNHMMLLRDREVSIFKSTCVNQVALINYYFQNVKSIH